MRVFASMRGAGNLARMRTFLTLLFSLLFVAGACARDITTAQPTLPTLRRSTRHHSAITEQWLPTKSSKPSSSLSIDNNLPQD